MSATQQQREFAGNLIEEISRTFFYSYYTHANGLSEDEMLIDYDITAAFNDVDTALRDTIRKTIRSACAAYDQRIDFSVAQKYLNEQLNAHVDRLLSADAHTAAEIISHALD